MELIYEDRDVLVCIKPSGVISTDEPGGVPELAREALHMPKAFVKTVHRLDQVVGGLMVLACNDKAASNLSRQIRENKFEKEYQAVVYGAVSDDSGTLTDLLARNKQERKTYVVSEPGKNVQQAVLEYKVLGRTENLTKLAIRLHTGRTHQIRVQFSSREHPLVGDRKYGIVDDSCPIALWSWKVGFFHPKTGEYLEFKRKPPEIYPWVSF